MSSVKFENCGFSNCNIHVGDNNYNIKSNSSSDVSNALALGGLLLGGVVCFPSLLSAVAPVCILGAKSVLLGTTVYCGSSLVKTLVSANKEENQLKLNSPKDSKNFIEIKPTKVYDTE